MYVELPNFMIFTLKNQAPDFFHISRCSAQILHSQIVPSASDPLAVVPNAELNREVSEELREFGDVVEDCLEPLSMSMTII